MIQTEFYRTRDDGVNLYRTYSDANLMIQKDGTDEMYSEAIDVENSGFTYVETDTCIEHEAQDDETMSLVEEKARAYDIIVGGEQNESD